MQTTMPPPQHIKIAISQGTDQGSILATRLVDSARLTISAADARDFLAMVSDYQPVLLAKGIGQMVNIAAAAWDDWASAYEPAIDNTPTVADDAFSEMLQKDMVGLIQGYGLVCVLKHPG